MRRRADRVSYAAASSRCNNNCVFCTDISASGKRRSHGEIDALRGRARGGRLMLSVAEPTLNEGLFSLVASARDSGYKALSVITNGRRLCYPAYCARLLSSGISEVIVSLHGATAEVHDAVTGVPGSWRQTMAGINNLLRLRRLAPRVSVSVNATVCSLNIGEVRPLRDLFLSLEGLRNVVFHGLRPGGRALAGWRRLCVPYTRMVGELASGLKRWPRRLRLWDVPRCVSCGLVPEGNCEFARPRTSMLSAEGAGSEKLCGKFLLAACRRCSRRAVCGGVYRRYAEVFGRGEFHALP